MEPKFLEFNKWKKSQKGKQFLDKKDQEDLHLSQHQSNLIL